MKNLITRVPQENNMNMPFFIKFALQFLMISCTWVPMMLPEIFRNCNKMESLMSLIVLLIIQLIII